uniref:Uncharacterized protein n=1 Tax=Oryza glaberrima TaxID=4538 RepID=I1QE20_ORYGL
MALAAGGQVDSWACMLPPPLLVAIVDEYAAACATVDSTGTVDVPTADEVADVLSSPGGRRGGLERKVKFMTPLVWACMATVSGSGMRGYMTWRIERRGE